jgi:nucleoprotein TPR
MWEFVTLSVAGRPVDTPPRLTKPKMIEDRAVATLPKPSTEVRRPGGRRPLVRPTLERTEEPQADADTSAVDVSMVGQDKGGSSLERETSGSLLVLQPSSRKRLISSAQSIDSASQGDANEANPPSKKPKEEEASQGTSEHKSGQPPVGDVVTHVGVLPSTDDQDGQQSTEEMDTDQASTPIEEVLATKDDDMGDKDDSGAHVDASLDTKGQDADIDTNTVPIDVLAKSDTLVESFDEDQKIEELKEDAQLTTATDVDDDMEEGELPEEPEQPLESALGETNREPTSDIGEQAGNVFRAASPGMLTEKSDVDVSEVEGDTMAAAVEPDQSPVAQSGAANASPSRVADASPAREPSPNPVQAGASSRPQSTNTTTEAREPSSSPAQAGASSEPQNTSTVTEASETRSRTINLTERARLNRQTRFQRAQPPTTARGRGQLTQRVWFPYC